MGSAGYLRFADPVELPHRVVGILRLRSGSDDGTPMAKLRYRA
jgi:hypothetical protein